MSSTPSENKVTDAYVLGMTSSIFSVSVHLVIALAIPSDDDWLIDHRLGRISCPGFTVRVLTRKTLLVCLSLGLVVHVYITRCHLSWIVRKVLTNAGVDFDREWDLYTLYLAVGSSNNCSMATTAGNNLSFIAPQVVLRCDGRTFETHSEAHCLKIGAQSPVP